jgi:hypothetical protein
MKVVFMTATRRRPHDAYLKALEDSCPVLDAAGIDHRVTNHIASPYIAYAQADMLHQALQTDADMFMYIEDDESWAPGDILKVLETDGDVVAGTYRFKHADDHEEYMGSWHCDVSHRAITRSKDGAIKAHMVPTGFLKITREAVRKFMRAYPKLIFGDPIKPAVDLFQHGAVFQDGRWWGQDYAFCKRWADIRGDIWLVPNLNINHHDWHSDRVWKGNLHEFLMRSPGGVNAPPAGKVVPIQFRGAA